MQLSGLNGSGHKGSIADLFVRTALLLGLTKDMAVTTPSKAVTSPTPDEDGDSSESRVHIRNIKELPSGHDEEIAVIFREMRHAVDLPVEQLSGQLKTPAATLEALEGGNILALPDWTETSRVIVAYTQLLGLDSRPVLRRLKTQLTALGAAAPRPEGPPAEANSRAPGPVAVPAGPPSPPGAKVQPHSSPPQPAAPERSDPPGAATGPAASVSAPAKDRGRHRAKLLRGGARKRFSTSAIVSWLLLLVFFATMAMGVLFLIRNPKIVWSTVDGLPEPVSRTVKSVWELVRPIDETDGGRVIVDPNKQKSDKLPRTPGN